MSFAALAWAAKQRPGNLAAKMVLLGLANFADEHGCSYPSTAALAEFGDMDHKTATAALDKLVVLKLIQDSGERAGRTKQIKVYRLSLESLPKTEASQKRKPPVFSPKDPQKRGTDTIREPISSEAKASSDKRARAKAKPAHRLPEEWAPEPLVAGTVAFDTVQTWAPGRIERELSKFRDYWAAASGAKARKHDWQAAWRTWISNAEDFGTHNGRQQRPDTLRGTRPDPALDMWLQAKRDRAVEDQGVGGGDWPALPTVQSG